MTISSDSDDDYSESIFQRLEVNKRVLRPQRKSSRLNTININNSFDDDVILVSESYDNRRPITRNQNTSDDVTFVSETFITSQPSFNDLLKNYDSTDIFLNCPVVASRGRGKRKKPIESTEPVRGKRGRGGARGKKNTNDSVSTPKRARGRGRRGKSGSNTPTTPEISIAPVRGRGRGRGRQGRGGKTNATRRTSARQSRVSSIPTYNIGNTADYPDASSHISLFKSVPEKPVVNDIDTLLHNEEITVQVLWRSTEVVTFKIRKLQKISQIFDFFYEREGVSRDRLLFMYNDKILEPDDTPETIDYSFGNFIDGGITSQSLSLPNPEPKTVEHGFVLKFQCQGRKKPYVVSVRRDETLQLPLLKCAEHLEVPITNLRFEFDGETVRGTLTPKDLDMDSGDCIDVKILNENK